MLMDCEHRWVREDDGLSCTLCGVRSVPSCERVERVALPSNVVKFRNRGNAESHAE